MRRDGEPVRPGVGTTRFRSRAFEPAKQIGTRSAYTIRASGIKTPRQQAGHKTVPDSAAMPSKNPCNAEAIHTRTKFAVFRAAIDSVGGAFGLVLHHISSPLMRAPQSGPLQRWGLHQSSGLAGSLIHDSRAQRLGVDV